MMSKKAVRTYNEETKVQAVKLAKEIGTQKEAVQLNIPYETLAGVGNRNLKKWIWE